MSATWGSATATWGDPDVTWDGTEDAEPEPPSILRQTPGLGVVKRKVEPEEDKPKNGAGLAVALALMLLRR